MGMYSLKIIWCFCHDLCNIRHVKQLNYFTANRNWKSINPNHGNDHVLQISLKTYFLIHDRIKDLKIFHCDYSKARKFLYTKSSDFTCFLTPSYIKWNRCYCFIGTLKISKDQKYEKFLSFMLCHQ